MGRMCVYFGVCGVACVVRVYGGLNIMQRLCILCIVYTFVAGLVYIINHR